MRGKQSLTFVLHPKHLVALRSKTTEILYGAANRRKAASIILVWPEAIKGLANTSISEQFRSARATEVLYGGEANPVSPTVRCSARSSTRMHDRPQHVYSK